MKRIFLAFILVFSAHEYAMDISLSSRELALCVAYTLTNVGIAVASGEQDACDLALGAVRTMAAGAVHTMLNKALMRIAQDPLSHRVARAAAGVGVAATYIPTLVGVADAMEHYLISEAP